jgi:hypothetical protein
MLTMVVKKGTRLVRLQDSSEWDVTSTHKEGTVLLTKVDSDQPESVTFQIDALPSYFRHS